MCILPPLKKKKEAGVPFHLSMLPSSTAASWGWVSVGHRTWASWLVGLPELQAEGRAALGSGELRLGWLLHTDLLFKDREKLRPWQHPQEDAGTLSQSS